MTTEELVLQINRNHRVRAEKIDGRIFVYNDTSHLLFTFDEKATNFLDFTFNDQLPSDSMGKASREYITAQIEAYMDTPIEKRGLEQHSSNPGVSERLNREWSDLDEKLDSLNTFMHSEKFGALPSTQARLLDFQYQIMGIYQKIVAWRIQTLGEGGQDDVD